MKTRPAGDAIDCSRSGDLRSRYYKQNMFTFQPALTMTLLVLSYSYVTGLFLHSKVSLPLLIAPSSRSTNCRMVANTFVKRNHRNRPLVLSATSMPSSASSSDSDKPSHEVDVKIVRQSALLVDLWGAIAYPEEFEETNFRLKDYGLSRNDVKGFLNHFQACKDFAADSAFLIASQNEQNEDILNVRQVEFNLLTEESDDDDWGNYDASLLGDDYVPNENMDPIFPIESDDEIIVQDTRKWVSKVIADFGVCPFTVDPDLGGIPMGGIRYSVSRATNPDEAFYRYWEEVLLMLITPERQVSTVLLIFPEMGLFGNYELFEGYCECLSDALTTSSIGLESDMQLVFFHPKFQFRDGNARSEMTNTGAANYARRSPWPMINILRTPQVRAAQKGVPTGVVYKQNEERLGDVGTDTLERMLQSRDWTGLPVHSTSTKAARRVQQEKEKVEFDALMQSKNFHPILTSLSDEKQGRPSTLWGGDVAATAATTIGSIEDDGDDDENMKNRYHVTNQCPFAGDPAKAAAAGMLQLLLNDNQNAPITASTSTTATTSSENSKADSKQQTIAVSTPPPPSAAAAAAAAAAAETVQMDQKSSSQSESSSTSKISTPGTIATIAAAATTEAVRAAVLSDNVKKNSHNSSNDHNSDNNNNDNDNINNIAKDKATPPSAAEAIDSSSSSSHSNDNDVFTTQDDGFTYDENGNIDYLKLADDVDKWLAEQM